ncbi:hypothetical protein [Alicyclobacillus dauci]|uniref:Spore germination protein gerPA/gerPF n=1 Tax=Alicyclobacillus dauci TaxID=1475485 RepID=A0ABY6YYD2_9BACL|nr:hypothetical protein [Alicyclobacillus dauci]WAH35268.1 hypothetical protein NZD86_13210 [Alicyclobacillus dauci]
MTSFKYGSLQIDRVENTSGVFYGRNVHFDFVSRQKINEGVGDSHGINNQFEENRSVVIDGDFLDSFFE